MFRVCKALGFAFQHLILWRNVSRHSEFFSVCLQRGLEADVTSRCNGVTRDKKYAKTRTQIQSSKPKREITKITNSQNTTRTYGQPSEQLFPKRWPLSNANRTKNNMNTRKVKRHRNFDTKNRQQRTTTNLPPWNGQ